MTILTFKSRHDSMVYPAGLHVLTYAEVGFAPLNIHGGKFGISRETLAAFADEVNRADGLGSLHPLAPISAVPRSWIRDTEDPGKLIEHFNEFLVVNAATLHASNLLLDFSTPQLRWHVKSAIMAVFAGERDCGVDEVTVINN